jgi:hypothetical protein
VVPAFLGSTRRKIGFALALLLLIAIAVFVWQAITAARSLSDARHRADEIKTAIEQGDFALAAQDLQQLQHSAHDAHQATSGLLWDIGRYIPFLGRNIHAVQVVSSVLDTASAQNAPVALQLSQRVDAGQFRPHDGQFDLAVFRELTPAVTQAAAGIDRADDQLAGIHPESLLFPFKNAVATLQKQIADARSAADATSTAFRLAPQMLGGDGARTYLLMIQNPAEIRSTGGLPGSLALLHADRGRLTMGWQGSDLDINGGPNGFPAPVVRLAHNTALQYGPTPASDIRDSNFTPDYPEAAGIARAMVLKRLGGSIDGVLSIDPIAMAMLLSGTGPINVDGAVLTPANLVAGLLNTTYQTVSNPLAQDHFFEAVARQAFNAVAGGQGDQKQAIKALANAGGQHRVLIWSARPDEERLLSGTSVAGGLNDAPPKDPAVGVYFNDALAAKAGYYLHYQVTTAAVDCRNDGSQDLRTTVTLVSTMPANYQSLSPYIIGLGLFAPQGTIAVNMRIYAPRGGSITDMMVDGTQHSVTADQHDGRQVGYLPIALRPGQRMTVAADLRSAPGQSGDGVLSFTPGMIPTPNGVMITSAC